MKHDPGADSPSDVYWLNESAEALITIVALNHASSRKLASQQFIKDHRTERVGREIKAVLAKLPDPLPVNY